MYNKLLTNRLPTFSISKVTLLNIVYVLTGRGKKRVLISDSYPYRCSLSSETLEKETNWLLDEHYLWSKHVIHTVINSSK